MKKPVKESEINAQLRALTEQVRALRLELQESIRYRAAADKGSAEKAPATPVQPTEGSVH